MSLEDSPIQILQNVYCATNNNIIITVFIQHLTDRRLVYNDITQV